MLAQGVGRCLLPQRSRPARSSRGLCSAAATDALDRVRALLQLCADRHYICPGESNAEMFRRGWSCGYGPLGVELRRNLLQQWWHSVSGSRARVFAVDTLSSSVERGAGGARVVGSEHFQQILGQPELSGERLTQELKRLMLSAPSLRPSLLQGALEQFVPSLEMVNKTLPFGLAEAGLCFQPSDGSGCNELWLIRFSEARINADFTKVWMEEAKKAERDKTGESGHSTHSHPQREYAFEGRKGGSASIGTGSKFNSQLQEGYRSKGEGLGKQLIEYVRRLSCGP